MSRKSCKAKNMKQQIRDEIRETRMCIRKEMYLESDSHLPNKISFIYFNKSLSEMIKNAFLFHLTDSFRSQNI